ncbi:hypothetical protein AA313_de0209861 [Arthrobotrys entomopaga]|nr:hypothetical protein AA313_de0209861 [Arthrobotrys entomopaga]
MSLQRRASQNLKDQLEGETTQLFQEKLVIDTQDKAAKDPAPGEPGSRPNKYSGPEFEKAQEEHRQKYREAGYSEEYVGKMKIPDVIIGSTHFHIPDEREREEIRAMRKKAAEHWEEIFYRAIVREMEAKKEK